MNDLNKHKDYIFSNFGVDLTKEELSMLIECLISSQLQPAINILGKKSSSIALINEIIQYLKIEVSKSLPNVLIENDANISVNANITNNSKNIDVNINITQNSKFQEINEEYWIVKFLKWVKNLFIFINNNKNVTKIQNDNIQFIENSDSQINIKIKNSKEDDYFLLIDEIVSELKKTPEINEIKSVKNPFGISFIYEKNKYWICPKKISSAHLQNKDLMRVQFSGSLKYDIHGEFIPMGIDVENRVFVFWNPKGFLSRVVNNKNSSFYSSLIAQKETVKLGVKHVDLQNEKIIISGINDFNATVLNQLLTLSKPVDYTYKIDQVYSDLLTVKSPNDQISRWMASKQEIENAKNPFNNYRGIRTLEFSSKKLTVPAFFIFVSTFSERKDTSANIWTDKFDEKKNEFLYNGDAKPGRDFLHNQNHGNCRLWKVYKNGKDFKFPPVLYFIKVSKGKMQFKGVFKMIEIKQTKSESDGLEFQNLKILLNRDNLITELDCNEILKVRNIGLIEAQKIDWYSRNCNRI